MKNQVVVEAIKGADVVAVVTSINKYISDTPTKEDALPSTWLTFFSSIIALVSYNLFLDYMRWMWIQILPLARVSTPPVISIQHTHEPEDDVSPSSTVNSQGPDTGSPSSPRAESPSADPPSVDPPDAHPLTFDAPVTPVTPAIESTDVEETIKDTPVIKPPTPPLSPTALNAIWNAVALQEADASSLPPPYVVEDALSKLLVTFSSPKPRKNEGFANRQSSVEPTLLMYCPLEGGEVGIYQTSSIGDLFYGVPARY